jgi:glycine oxidase
LPVEWITGSQARELEPLLSPKCTNAIWVPEDGQIDNRKLMDTLLDAFHKHGGKLHEIANVHEIKIENNRIVSIIVNDKEVKTSTLIVAAGAWSKQIEGLPENVLPPVRPVKGQILSLRMNPDFQINHAIRAPDVYLVPKKDGRLIVGASNEEMGFDTNPTAGEIFRLLERGWETVPAIYDLPIEEIQVGLRPGSRDHEPIIGDSGIEGLYFATGHYRNGILLAPVTAFELSDWIITGNRPAALEHFQLSRFYKETV